MRNTRKPSTKFAEARFGLIFRPEVALPFAVVTAGFDVSYANQQKTLLPRGFSANIV